MEQNEAWVSTDTGTAVHRAVELFYAGVPVDEVVAKLPAMKTDPERGFPRADLDDAERMFRYYARDPRNTERPLLVEQKVEVALDPHPTDPTQAPIVIRGTLDQVRMSHGIPHVWDLKTSKKSNVEVTHGYTMQLAAYVLGASQALGCKVEPGGFINPRNYFKRGADAPEDRPTSIFLHVTWTHEQALMLLDPVRLAVAAIRRGEYHPIPGDHCFFCPTKGIDVCLPKLLSLPTV